MQERIYHCIGAASCWGAQIRTCEDGPDAIKQSGCQEELQKQNISVAGWESLYPKVLFKETDLPLKDVLPLISEFNNRLADKVFEVVGQGRFPVVIGGDHSIAVGTWNGVVCSISQQSQKPLGLIWIDAHMDSHTVETSLSGAWHGMPLAALMGHGTKELAEARRSAPILMPENVCLIGVRSYEEGEQKLLEKLNVRIYFMEEVNKRGFQTVLQEAIQLVSKNTVGYGVSLDIDVIDPSEAPGAGSPEPGGISGRDLLKGLEFLKGDPSLKAFELVEFNPHLDVENKTLNLCKQILSTVLS